MARNNIFLSHETALAIHRFTDPMLVLKKAGHSRFSLPKTLLSAHNLAECRANLQLLLGKKFNVEKLLLHYMTAENHGRGSEAFAHAHPTTHEAYATFYREIHEGIYVAVPELALLQVARSMERIALLEFVYQMCGIYWIYSNMHQPINDDQSFMQCKPLTSRARLERFCRQNPSLSGARKVSRVLRYVADGSASPMESKTALALGLPASWGGANFGAPLMNQRVVCTEPGRQLSGRREFRADLLWSQRKIIVEYQSKKHHRNEESWLKDSTRMNALVGLGYHLYYMTPEQLYDQRRFSAFVRVVKQGVGLRHPTKFKDLEERRAILWERLGLS